MTYIIDEVSSTMLNLIKGISKMKPADFLMLNSFFDDLQQLTDEKTCLRDDLILKTDLGSLVVRTDLEHHIYFTIERDGVKDEGYSGIVYMSVPDPNDEDYDIYFTTSSVTRDCILAYLTLKEAIENNNHIHFSIIQSELNVAKGFDK